MNDDAMDAWLGPVELTSEQRDRFAAIWDDVDGRYPDDADAVNAALSAAVQYLLGETGPEDAGREIARLTAALEDARAAARVVAVLAIADRESESALAARMGVTRMTVRKWLGKGYRETTKSAPLPRLRKRGAVARGSDRITRLAEKGCAIEDAVVGDLVAIGKQPGGDVDDHFAASDGCLARPTAAG